MRIRWLLFAFGVCTVSPGCSLFVTAARDLTYEAKLRVQECFEDRRNVRLAKDAYSHLRPGKCDSHDYASGFKTGFADFLRAGGTGQPPPLPPRHYWGYLYQSPEGHKAIEQWYAGFRDGAAAAQASGLRQFMVVPTQTVLLPPMPPPLPGTPPVPPVAAPGDDLPAPRPVPGGLAPAEPKRMPDTVPVPDTKRLPEPVPAPAPNPKPAGKDTPKSAPPEPDPAPGQVQLPDVGAWQSVVPSAAVQTPEPPPQPFLVPGPSPAAAPAARPPQLAPPVDVSSDSAGSPYPVATEVVYPAQDAYRPAAPTAPPDWGNTPRTAPRP